MDEILGAVNAGHSFPVTAGQQGLYPGATDAQVGKQNANFLNREAASTGVSQSEKAGVSNPPASSNSTPPQVVSGASAPFQVTIQTPSENDQSTQSKNKSSEQTEKQEEGSNNFSSGQGINGQPLTASEKLLLQKLRQIDISVRAHERAHLSAAGGIAVSGASFQYTRGADGRDYAVGGEVRIDTSPGSTPEATAAKMQQVRAAALAPADPSPQDRNVASQASKVMVQAQMEIQENRTVEAQEKVEQSKEASRLEEEQQAIEETNGENSPEASPERPFQQAAATAGYEAFFPTVDAATGINGGIDITV